MADIRSERQFDARAADRYCSAMENQSIGGSEEAISSADCQHQATYGTRQEDTTPIATAAEYVANLVLWPSLGIGIRGINGRPTTLRCSSLESQRSSADANIYFAWPAFRLMHEVMGMPYNEWCNNIMDHRSVAAIISEMEDIDGVWMLHVAAGISYAAIWRSTKLNILFSEHNAVMYIPNSFCHHNQQPVALCMIIDMQLSHCSAVTFHVLERDAFMTAFSAQCAIETAVLLLLRANDSGQVIDCRKCLNCAMLISRIGSISKRRSDLAASVRRKMSSARLMQLMDEVTKMVNAHNAMQHKVKECIGMVLRCNALTIHNNAIATINNVDLLLKKKENAEHSDEVKAFLESSGLHRSLFSIQQMLLEEIQTKEEEESTHSQINERIEGIGNMVDAEQLSAGGILPLFDLEDVNDSDGVMAPEFVVEQPAAPQQLPAESATASKSKQKNSGAGVVLNIKSADADVPIPRGDVEMANAVKASLLVQQANEKKSDPGSCKKQKIMDGGSTRSPSKLALDDL